jgi:seryl-tRNA synthetase
MSRESYAATIIRWRRYLDGLDEDLAKSNATVNQVALLTALYGRAQELVRERDNLRASMQTTTRELQEVLRQGRTATAYLSAAVKVEFPRNSPELHKLGIKVGGRPRGRKKAPTPQE